MRGRDHLFRAEGGEAAGDVKVNRLPQIDYGRHPSYQFEPDPAGGLLAAQQLALLVEDVVETEAHRLATFGYRYGARSDDGRTLLEDGAARFQLSAPVVETLTAEAAPLLAALRERMGAALGRGEVPRFADRMARASSELHAPFWAAVEQAMREIGAYELTSAFYSAEGAKLQNVGILISTPQDKESLRLAETPAAGLHVDSSGKCILKAVLYLSEVTAEQGPFGLVHGSHHWDPGSIERIHRRAFDRSDLKGRSSNALRRFISLPEHMQVKAEFGADMLPEWDQTQALLADERVALGQPGLISLFDPEAVHRGGLVTAGERCAVLITMNAVY